MNEKNSSTLFPGGICHTHALWQFFVKHLLFQCNSALYKFRFWFATSQQDKLLTNTLNWLQTVPKNSEMLCLLNLLAIHPWAEMETKNKTNTVVQLSKQSSFIRVILLYFIISLAQSLEPKRLAPETFQHTSPIRFQASCNSVRHLGVTLQRHWNPRLYWGNSELPVGYEKICTNYQKESTYRTQN